ncbi:MAG: glycosyltransferase [Bdellovibrio sp.]|nr:MAG: glycosyltransferase [Bdellovibrio sp.]
MWRVLKISLKKRLLLQNIVLPVRQEAAAPVEVLLSKHQGAISVFVKTPGYSPIKTRLAKDLGEDKALAFYNLAIEKTRQKVQKVCQEKAWKPYWAVAEKAALNHPLWRDFEVIDQGAGGLGERMGRVYQSLAQRHRAVVFLGADTPHLPESILKEALGVLTSSCVDFVLGPSEDGGFYLFGGKLVLPLDFWSQVPYSTDQTMNKFVVALREFYPQVKVSFLSPFFDVDTESEYLRAHSLLT